MLKLAFTGGFYVYNRFCFKSCHSKEISGAILPNSTNCTKVIGDIILPRGKGK